MDKNFNDQELSDIMKEIEALEEDFTSNELKTSPVIEDLAQLEEEVSVPETKAKVLSLDTPKMETKSPSTEKTSMSFKVQGNLTMELSFDIGGKVVNLEISETGLSIEMAGGAKFTVPVSDKTSAKKAA
jgi:hypothetical protein